MHLLDPYGIGASTPDTPPGNQGDPLAVPERQEEVDLALDVPPEEQQPVSEHLDASSLDPAMRLQDGVGTWVQGDAPAPEGVGAADSPDPNEPVAQPFAPLTDSGGQGI